MNCYFYLSFSENPHSSCHEGGELPSSPVLPLSGLIHPAEGRSSQVDSQSVLRGRQWHLPAQPRLVSGASVRKGTCLRCLTARRYFSRLPGSKERESDVKEREQLWQPRYYEMQAGCFRDADVFHCRGVKWEWRASEVGCVTVWTLHGLSFRKRLMISDASTLRHLMCFTLSIGLVQDLLAPFIDA